MQGAQSWRLGHDRLPPHAIHGLSGPVDRRTVRLADRGIGGRVFGGDEGVIRWAIDWLTGHFWLEDASRDMKIAYLKEMYDHVDAVTGATALHAYKWRDNGWVYPKDPIARKAISKWVKLYKIPQDVQDDMCNLALCIEGEIRELKG